MKAFVLSLLFACVASFAGGAAAQDAMKKDSAMTKDATAKPMTMQECKDHMAMSAKAGTKKDDAMMKKDAMCADVMKKDSGTSKEAAPKK